GAPGRGPPTEVPRSRTAAARDPASPGDPASAGCRTLAPPSRRGQWPAPSRAGRGPPGNRANSEAEREGGAVPGDQGVGLASIAWATVHGQPTSSWWARA